MDVIILGSIAIAFAGFLQGCLGFGFGMISVPPLLMLLTAAEVIPMQIALSLFLTLPLAHRERHHLKPMLVGPLLIGAVIGLPAGMLVLYWFDGPYLKIAVGIILVFMAIAMLSGWSYYVKRQLPILFPVGFLSGVMATSFSMAGPPIILFLTNQDMEKSAFRGNILVYFTALGIISTIGYIIIGAFPPHLLKLMAIFFPTLMISGFMGAWASQHIPQLTFRRITLVMAAIMGLLLVIRNGFAIISG